MVTIQLKQRQRWSQIIDTNIAHGTNQQRLDLLQEIVATGDRYLLAEYLIELMVAQDKQEILNGDLSFLDSVLRGDGWTGYSFLSIEQNIAEFVERESTHEYFFDSDNERFQQLLTTMSAQTRTQFMT
jgi:hypothetical protein